jgi:predicted DNA binding CopG/RHH family protein
MDKSIGIRLAEDDYQAIAEAADSEGLTVSRYVRHAALGTAIADPQIREIILSDSKDYSFEKVYTSRLTAEELAQVQAAADEHGLTLVEYMKEVLRGISAPVPIGKNMTA